MAQPIIGITSYITEDKLTVPTTYINAVSSSGGIPIVLPKITDDTQIAQQIERVDGLLLTGGDDIDPSLFDEDPHRNLGNIEPGRDTYESKLIGHFIEKDKAVLAICRGAQILNISQGGTMYQDIYAQIDGGVMQHKQNAPRNHLSHSITVDADSRLHEILGDTSIKTNSFHHQANRDVPGHFTVSARANDGVIEAVESKNHKFVLGLQWHPEASFSTDESSQQIFKAFIEAASS